MTEHPGLSQAIQDGLFVVHNEKTHTQRSMWYRHEGMNLGPIHFPTPEAIDAFINKARANATQVGH